MLKFKLNFEDFKNDEKDAGEIGSGHTVTVLYEIVTAKEGEENSNDLKYQKLTTNKEAYKTKELALLKLRYKPVDENGVFAEKSEAVEKPLLNNSDELEDTSNNFRFSAAVAEFGMILRESKFIKNGSIKQVIELGKGAKGKDDFGYRSEFIQLVEKYELIKK